MLHWIEDVANVPSECRGAIVSIGNFDGVHLGHLRLVECMRWLAKAENLSTVAVTFDPHPVRLLRPEIAPQPLTDTGRKAELLADNGVDELLVLKTSPELLGLSAEDFFHHLVHQGLQTCGLVEGPNFRFGRNRTGSIDTLNRLCPAYGVLLEVVDPMELEGAMVSSSRIRQSLSKGQVELAARLLGRPHRLRGRVGPGAGRGSQLGFPTANIEGCETLVPCDGVYAAQALVASTCWPAALNIGPNPTFGQNRRKIEAHLIGFAGQLQGQMLQIDLLARIRDTQPFPSPEKLIEQIRRDVEQVKSLALAKEKR